MEDHLPGKASGCGVTAANNRPFIEAALWIARTGSPWRDLPDCFGKWHRVYVRYNRWGHKGIWSKLLEAVADAMGYPIHLLLTAGQVSGCMQAEALIEGFETVADKGYDFDAFILALSHKVLTGKKTACGSGFSRPRGS